MNKELKVAYEDFKSRIEIKPSELIINDKGDKVKDENIRTFCRNRCL